MARPSTPSASAFSGLAPASRSLPSLKARISEDWWSTLGTLRTFDWKSIQEKLHACFMNKEDGRSQILQP